MAPCRRLPPHRRRRRSPPTSACRPGSRRGRPCCTSPSGRPACRSCPASPTRLAAAAGANGYGPVAGSPAVREAVAGYFERRGLPTSAGSHPRRARQQGAALRAARRAAGDVVLTAPVVGELRRAGGAGRASACSTSRSPSRRAASPTPTRCARRSRRRAPAGHEPAILVLTLPDNPTGTVAPAALVEAVCEVAARARPAHRLRRDLPRPRLRARGAAQPRRRCCPRASSSPTG